MSPPYSNVAKDLNLTITEPPLKKLKKKIENLPFASESQPAKLAEMASFQIQDQINFISSELSDTGSPKESNLDKWRKSFQVSSVSSLNPNMNPLINEFDLISDGFFSDPIVDDKTNVINDDLDFGSDLFSDIENELEAVSLSNFESNKPYHRVKIIRIIESFYLIQGKNFQNPQKEIQCCLIENDVTRIDFSPLKVLIRGEWLECKLKEEAIINLIGPIRAGEIVIDDENNYLVIEPDILINTTGIADSFTCLRRAVLSFRNQTSVEDNKPSASLIIGSIVHELVEEAFRTSNFKEIHTNDPKLNFLISKKIEEIFCTEKDENFIKEKVVETMKNFPKWCQLYIRKFPAIHAFVQESKQSSANGNTGPSTICISKILDLEENIWSAMFGLKGKIDSTILMKFADKNSKQNEYLTSLCPFELKTGQITSNLNHRAQTLLYTLMLNDRYRKPIDYGLLFYITTGDLIRISAYRRDIQSILIKRNILAEQLIRNPIDIKSEDVFLKNTCKLPSQILNEHLCKKCFQVETCLMYHKLTEGGTTKTSSVPKLFEEKTLHLDKEEYGNFLMKWENLITLEELESTNSRSELWRFQSEKRSKRGKCLIGMKLISSEEIPESKDSNRFICKFERFNLNEGIEASLLNSYISEGDPVVISYENDQISQYALATGVVSSLTADSVVIYSDRPVNPIFSFEESFELENSNANVLYCIDKNELTGSFGLLRANMIKLFSVECQKLLDLIVNQRPPKFLPRFNNNFNESLLKEFDESYGLFKDFQIMDEYQREAFYKAIETLDYSLILGMPGTGKTTTLSFIIRYLVLIMGKSVLISSHTHTAIDHIALKLQERNLPFLRLGFEGKVDKSIKSEYLLSKKQFKTVSEVEYCYSNARVVICTSFGMNHSIFMRKRFDICIVDEASQLTLPACIGSLRVAQSFILVGDHFQLPPLVRSKDALKLGYGESVFKILADSNPNSMSKLCHQYRMNEEIMLIANRLTYNNLLKCGSESVKNQILEIKNIPQIEWLKCILTPSCKVAFLNTDKLSNAHEVLNGNSFHNEGEAEIIKLILKTSLSIGIKESQISLISPYRPQLKYLNFPEFKNIVISTIDKFQGKDSDFVIISLVRSNISGNVGELLKDWQRLNVAFTRAKKKLILVGSAGTILNNPPFRKLAELIQERGWLFDIPSE